MVALRRLLPGHNDRDDMWVLPEVPARKHHLGRPEPSLLDRILPRHDVRSVSEVTIDAPPHDLFEALRNVTPGEIRALSLLSRLPRRLHIDKSAFGTQTLLHASKALHLGEIPDRECVVGYVGTLHNVRDQRRVDLPDLFTFMRFNDPGFEKMAISFQAVPLTDGRTRLVADLRIVALGPATRRKLRTSWYLRDRWYGKLLLHQVLGATKRRAEGNREPRQAKRLR
jgi:hypothetical protein